MSFLNQMKHLCLINCSLILFLASNSIGQSWNVSVTQHINTSPGSNVAILCTFTYPKKYHTDNVQVYWKKPKRSKIKTGDKDTNVFVFHTNTEFVFEKYRGKTRLLGNRTDGNCSLEILNITESEQNIYVRIKAKGEDYSFYEKPVSISVSGVEPVTFGQGTASPPFTISNMVETVGSSTIYVATFVPLSALLIVIFVFAIYCIMKQKRSQSFTREESGYYANFSRATPNQAQREITQKNHETPKKSDLKTIDDPIYVNTQALTGQMDERMDHIHNIYGNVPH